MKIVIVIIIPRPGCYDCSAAPCPLSSVVAYRFHYKSISSIKSSPKVSSLPQQYLSFLFFLLLLRTISITGGGEGRGTGAKNPKGFRVPSRRVSFDIRRHGASSAFEAGDICIGTTVVDSASVLDSKVCT